MNETEKQPGGSGTGGEGDQSDGDRRTATDSGTDRSGSRYTAEVDGEFVVFLIGMRINALWRIHDWLPVFLAMPRMLRELRARDRSALLSTRLNLTWRGATVVQYWEDFESLEAYARDPDAEHVDAWAEYDRRLADSGTVGIWHETYLVHPGEYEAVYNNLPPAGLADAGRVRDAEGRRASAAGRLGRTGGEEPPASPEGSAAD